MGKNLALQVIGTVLTAVGMITEQPWLIGMGISVAAGGVVRRLPSRQRDILSVGSTPDVALPLIYGSAKVGATLVDVRVCV